LKNLLLLNGDDWLKENKGNGKHPFSKYFNPNNSDRKGNGADKKKGNNTPKSDCGNAVFPMGYCSACNGFKESQEHHSGGVPEWIRRRFRNLGVFIKEALKIKVCPHCHNKMEKNRQNFQAVVMARYIRQMTEIDQLILRGREKNLTFEELSILADGGSLMPEVIIGQPLEVVVKEEN
jgi:hypothetical protein